MEEQDRLLSDEEILEIYKQYPMAEEALRAVAEIQDGRSFSIGFDKGVKMGLEMGKQVGREEIIRDVLATLRRPRER